MLRILTVLGCILIPVVSFADDQAVRRDAAIIEALTELSAQLPQQYLSLDAVAEHNEYDEDRIIKWVAENIQYSPSPGYQLTPENALLTATGNALEQSVLLQNILTQAGFEVRIAKADLSEETAIELLKQSFVASPANQWRFNDEVRDRYLKKFAPLYGEEESVLLERYQDLVALTPWNESKLYRNSRQLSEQLNKAIKDKGAWQVLADALRPWIKNAQDYYFVKYRLSQGDKWLQAHPAFVKNAPTIETSTYFTDDITSQYHQVTLQAFITRQIDGEKTETIAVTPRIERSSQQLFDGQLNYVTMPSNFQEALDKKTFQLIYESKYYIPIVDGELSEKIRVFSLDGQDYAAKDILDAKQKFINTVKDKANKAGSALDKFPKQTGELASGVNSESASVLLEYYFLIGWTAPNGDSRQAKRVIYRRQANETRKSVVQDISQSIVLAAEPATLSTVAQSSEELRTQIAILQLIQKTSQLDFSEAQVLGQITQWYKTQKNLHFNNTLALSRQPNSTQQFFSSSPMLAMIWEREDGEGEQPGRTTTFDYLINPAQIVNLSGNTLAIDTSATLAYGVWSTYSEALLQAQTQQGEAALSRDDLPENVVSAAGQFNQATKEGMIFDVVTNAKQLDRLNQLKPSLKNMLGSELNNNPQYLYILPKVEPDTGYFAYYRIDTQTGESLGYSVLGRGSTNTEYITGVEFRMIAGGLKGIMGALGCAAHSYTAESLNGFGRCMACAVSVGILSVGAVGGAELIKVAGAGVGIVCAEVGLLGGFD
jgi:hypothetical protein